LFVSSAGECELDVGQAERAPAGAAVEQVDRGLKDFLCIGRALGFEIDEPQTIKIVGDERMGCAKLALVDCRCFLD
jgi:hypothetical protein